MGRMTGRVAPITRGARGQGRAHAVRLAQQGADIVVTDLREQIPALPYATGTREGLDATAKVVQDLDRGCLLITADARDGVRMRGLADQADTLFAGGNADATVKDMGFPATACDQLPIPWMKPEAIAHGVLCLAPDEAKYVTGIALPVDAGIATQPPGITSFLGEALARHG